MNPWHPLLIDNPTSFTLHTLSFNQLLIDNLYITYPIIFSQLLIDHLTSYILYVPSPSFRAALSP